MIDGSLVKPAENLLPEGVTKDQEVIGKRRENGKTFDLGGGRFRVRTGIGAIHYKNYTEDEDELYKILTDIRKKFSNIIRDFNILRITETCKLNFFPF